MRSFVGLLRKDLKAYFDQPTGYILLVIFVGIVSYLYFRTALVNEEASMRPMFTTLPWVLAIFVPAATMRLIAEEQRDGTLEILFTQPIRASAVLLAKFPRWVHIRFHRSATHGGYSLGVDDCR